METNSWKTSVTIVAGSVKEGKTIHKVLVYVSWSSELVLVSEAVQCSSDSWIQDAASASVKMFSVTVKCAAVYLQSE
jgi:hypothetical protein